MVSDLGPVKTAVIAPATSVLRHGLEDQPPATLRYFPEPYAAVREILAFGPELIVFEVASGAEDLGALRMLLQLAPDSRAIVVAADGDHRALTNRCTALDLELWTGPDVVRRLRERLRRTTAADAEQPSGYLELVQGICDEINNPLMFASGHLQLLSGRLERQQDGAARSQITAIRDGLGRIERTMRKVATMSRATAGDRICDRFGVDRLAARIRERLRDSDRPVEIANSLPTTTLLGDLDLLTGAALSLVEVGHELADGTPPALAFTSDRTGPALRLQVADARLREWELPHIFEPYRLNRILRGTTLGLNLFLVRTVAQAHGSDASARRIGDRTVEFVAGLGPSQARGEFRGGGAAALPMIPGDEPDDTPCLDRRS